MTETFNIIRYHHADLVSEVLLTKDLYITGWDIQEELKMVLEVQCVVSPTENCRVDVHLYLIFNHNNVRLIIMDYFFFNYDGSVRKVRQILLWFVSVIIIKNIWFVRMDWTVQINFKCKSCVLISKGNNKVLEVCIFIFLRIWKFWNYQSLIFNVKLLLSKTLL